MNYLHHGRQCILFNATINRKPNRDWFTPHYWQQEKALQGEMQGRSSVFIIAQPHEHWILRHYQRGGLIGKINAERYLWFGLKSTRIHREFATLEHLEQLGLAPKPIAACIERSGIFYKGALITQRIESRQNLATCLLKGSLHLEIWYRLGQRIRQLHQQGVIHPDLNARNILIVNENECTFVDFDPSPGKFKQQNIPRLLRSLTKFKKRYPAFAFNSSHWSALLDGYRSGI